MFGISYPDNDDLLGWFLLLFPLSTALITLLMHLFGFFPSYGKLYDEGLAKNIYAPKRCTNFNINYKFGYFMLYFPSLCIIPIICFITIFVNNTSSLFFVEYKVYFWVNLCLLMTLFGKRCVETVFVHIFSRKTGNATSFALISYYFLTLTLPASYCIVNDLDGKNNINIHSNIIIIIGIAIFVFGQILNVYCYWKYRVIRKRKDEQTKYASLDELGKLFQIFIVPNYYGEILIWFGLFITQRSLASLIDLVLVSSNTLYILYQQSKWYKYQKNLNDPERVQLT